MADRTVSYVFRGNFSNLGAGLTTMGKGVNDLGLKLTALDAQGAKARRGLTQMGSAAGKIGLVAAAGVGAVVVAAANFEQAMSNVAATGQDARDSLDQLRAAAIKAGADTKFSAGEAAAGVENLLKAGVSAQDVLGGGLAGALDLAAAGGLEVADSAEIAATALTQFKLQGADIPHVADLLAAAAGKAQGDVTDMAMALKQSGLVAAQMGLSVEETAGVLAEFASAGLLGSDAGTSFRTMLLRLANPTVESAKLMKSLGIAAYDAQGNFVGIESLAGQLQVAFEGQSQATRDAALATIFGSDAIRGASVLYAGGSQAVAEWTGKVDDSGYAAETASIKMDNLKGDLEQLKGSLETALIGAGGSSQGPLREFTQDATKAVNAFSALPGPVKSTVTALTAITAITGGGLWFGTKVIGGIANTKQALADMSAEGSRAAGALRAVGYAAAGLAVLEVIGATVGALEKKFDHALPSTQALTKALLDLNDAEAARQLSDDLGDLGEAVDRLNAGGLTGIADNLNEVANSGGVAGNAIRGFAFLTGNSGISEGSRDLREYQASIDAVDEALAGIVTTGSPEQAKAAFESLAAAQGLSADEQAALLKLLPQYQVALDGVDNQTTLAAGSTSEYATALGGVGAEAYDAGQALADLVKAMQDQKDAAIGAFDAETKYRQAMKDAAEQARKSNAGLKGNSDEVLKNRDAIGGLAAAWNNQSQVVTDNVKKYKEARDNFIKTAVAMGVPKKAAKDLADQLLEIPTKIVTKTSAETGQATAALKALKARMDAIKDKHVTVLVSTVRPQGGQVPTEEGIPNEHGRRNGRTNLDDLDLVNPRTKALVGTSNAYAMHALNGLAKESDKAKESTKGLKDRLHDLEERFAKVSRAADAAHDALDSLKSQRADLASSVTGALTHDAFGGSLADFQSVTASDAAGAQAMLAALKTLIANGLDPHSQLFQRLAASGNVALVQQFAALTGSQLAAQAASFASGQSALNQVGAFAGQAAFNDLIAAQAKVTTRLDGTVHELAQQVKALEKAVKDMPDKVKQGSKDGTKEGSAEGGKKVADAIAGQAAAGYKRGL